LQAAGTTLFGLNCANELKIYTEGNSSIADCLSSVS